MRKLHYLMPVDVEEKIIVKYLVEQGAGINKETSCKGNSIKLYMWKKQCRKKEFTKEKKNLGKYFSRTQGANCKIQ